MLSNTFYDFVNLQANHFPSHPIWRLLGLIDRVIIHLILSSSKSWFEILYRKLVLLIFKNCLDSLLRILHLALNVIFGNVWYTLTMVLVVSDMFGRPKLTPYTLCPTNRVQQRLSYNLTFRLLGTIQICLVAFAS